MIANILSEVDRLWFNSHYHPKKQNPTPMPPVTIHVFDVNKAIAEDFQDQIESLNLLLEDQRDETQRWIKACDQWKVNFQQHQECMNDRNAAVARCTDMECQVQKLKKDLEVEVGNRDHFRQLVAQQDAFINEAKRQIAAYKENQAKIFNEKKGEAEHLARKCIQLQEENAKLKTDNLTLTEDNKKFQEQTTRLIEEKRILADELKDRTAMLDTATNNVTDLTEKNRILADAQKQREKLVDTAVTKMSELNQKLYNLDCQAAGIGTLCGGCISCQLRQADHYHYQTRDALDKREKELALEQAVGVQRWLQIEAATNALRELKKLKWYQFDAKELAIQKAQAVFSVCQQEVDKLRKAHYKKT